MNADMGRLGVLGLPKPCSGIDQELFFCFFELLKRTFSLSWSRRAVDFWGLVAFCLLAIRFSFMKLTSLITAVFAAV